MGEARAGCRFGCGEIGDFCPMVSILSGKHKAKQPTEGAGRLVKLRKCHQRPLGSSLKNPAWSGCRRVWTVHSRLGPGEGRCGSQSTGGS